MVTGQFLTLGSGMVGISELQVNGTAHKIDADPQRTLLSVLRDDLNLTGSKYGCGEGKCGACTVLLDGQARRSCITAVGAVGSRSVTTIEGLEKDGQLHPVQQALLDHEAMQCAYCTSGMIMSALALLQSNPDPTFEQIIEHMEGNICRCGTYLRIVAAIRDAAVVLRGAER